MIGELVARVKNEIRGERKEIDPHLSKDKQALANRKEDVVVEATPIDQGLAITVVADDSTGLLGLIAGVLSCIDYWFEVQKLKQSTNEQLQRGELVLNLVMRQI